MRGGSGRGGMIRTQGSTDEEEGLLEVVILGNSTIFRGAAEHDAHKAGEGEWS